MANERSVDKISGILAGVSGEYFVAAELSRRGYIATLTLKNTKGIDILVSNSTAKKSLGLQVKTNQGSRKAWVLNSKAEQCHEDNLFYVFVNLGGSGGTPEFHIVPSRIVATEIKNSHQQWLDNPGRKGQKHNDNSMRLFADLESKYLGRWDTLQLD
jgi:hypothetical protein